MTIDNYLHTQYNDPFIAQRADPFVTRGPEGEYYFTASVPAYDRVVLRKSATLDGLRDAEEITFAGRCVPTRFTAPGATP